MSERDQALQIRRRWMQQMGFSEEEVQEASEDAELVSLKEELANLRAAEKLDEVTPSSAELHKWGGKTTTGFDS